MRKCLLTGILGIVLPLFILSGCKNRPGKVEIAHPADPVALIRENEKRASERQYEDLGELIAVIPFSVKTDNTTDFEDGLIPWANLEKPELDMPNLVDKDEIVIKGLSVKVIIDYPLTNQYEFMLTSGLGFSRAQLLTAISKHYYLVYDEEEQTANVKTIPVDKRTTLVNRNQTDGKYGIWGHDIGDIDLSEINVYRTPDGQLVLTLNVES